MPEPTGCLPTWLVELYPPDRRIAVEFFRKLVDESMLRDIAKGAYGQEIEEQFSALTPIWNGEDWSELDCWFPMEALETMRWCEPEALPPWPGCAGLRGHHIRAFSCAVLLITSNFEARNHTLIQMLDSALVIGGGAPEAVAQFLTWKIQMLELEDDRPFFALALAAIARIGKRNLPLEVESRLANWVEEEEAQERKSLSHMERYKSSPWLFGLSWWNLRDDRWLALILKLQCEYRGGPIEQMLTRCFGECRVREIPSADL